MIFEPNYIEKRKNKEELELLECHEEISNGLIEYQIGSGKHKIPLPLYRKGDQGIVFSLKNLYRLTYAPFMKINHETENLEIKLKTLELAEGEEPEQTFELKALDPFSTRTHKHRIIVRVHQEI
jgi:hypothetical protein